MKLIKKFWPIIFIFAVWFIFASPYFFQHKVPFSSTYLVNFFSPWNAYPGFASPVKNNAMPDVITQIYPWKTFTVDTFKHLQIPLWNPYSFAGTTHLANYQSAVLSPFNLLFIILPFIDAWSLLVLLQSLFAGLFMYLFLKSLKINSEGSLIGSLAFMFCGFITTWMAYATLGYAILFLPLSLFAIEKFYQTPKNRFLILFAFTLPLSFFSGHFQISIYFFLFVLAYLAFKFYQTKNIPSTLYLILYTLLGLALSLPQLLPSIEAYMQSLRSGLFEKSEVIPWGYLSTFVAPDFLGNPVTRNDWFGHYAEWNAYLGLIPLMLACYSLFRNRTKEIVFFAIVAFLAILLSFQTPLLDLLIFLKIPVLSTSAAGRIIVLFSFSMSVLAGFGFERLFKDVEQKKIKSVFGWLTIFFLIFMSLWVVVLLKLFIPIDRIVVARQNLILPSVLFFAALIIFTSSFLVVHFKKNYLIKISILLLLVVVAFDLLRFTNKWMPFDSKNVMYPKIPVASEFSKISGVDRVFNGSTEAAIYYKLPSLEGYDTLYINRYGEFVASLNNGSLQSSSRTMVNFPKNGLYTAQAINLLGAKYIVHKIADGHAAWTFPFWEYKDGTFPLLYDDGVYQVFKNNDALPRTFLTNNYIIETNPQKILDRMFDSKFNLRNTLVLEEGPKVKLSGEGLTEIKSYSAEKVSIETNSSGNNLLFLSDSYYPGWQAYLDGKNVRIYRADFSFRAVLVPQGKHTVEFIYQPLSFTIGALLMVTSLTLVLILALAGKRGFSLFPRT